MDTITVTFPQVKINLGIKGLTFDSLESMVFDIEQHIGRKVLEKTLGNIDDILRKNRPKGTLENGGKRIKYLLTRLGDIRYRRTRYIDKTSGKSRYLLEEHLGLKPNQRLSLMRAKVEMFITSITSYRGARENVELITGYRRSHESMRQSVIKEADRIIAYQKSAIDKIKNLEFYDDQPVSSDIAYMEADATYIRLQRRRKIKSTSSLRKRRPRSIEVKLGIGYTGRENRYEDTLRSAKRLVNKFVYLSVSKCTSFMEDLSIIAESKMSLSGVKNVFFGADGDRWITRGIRDFFPGAVFILCGFHLSRNIRTALSYRKESQKEIHRLLAQDKIDEALGMIKDMLSNPKDKKEKEALRSLYIYIRENRGGINAIRRVEDSEVRHLARNTGAIEPNIDKIIAHRFKKRGMSWSVKGALSLLKIKETITNGEWDSWWSDKRDQKIEINREPLRQLTAKDLWKKGRPREPLIEAAITGPDQNEPWAKVLRELQKIDYYKIG